MTVDQISLIKLLYAKTAVGKMTVDNMTYYPKNCLKYPLY